MLDLRGLIIAPHVVRFGFLHHAFGVRAMRKNGDNREHHRQQRRLHADFLAEQIVCVAFVSVTVFHKSSPLYVNGEKVTERHGFVKYQIHPGGRKSEFRISKFETNSKRQISKSKTIRRMTDSTI